MSNDDYLAFITLNLIMGLFLPCEEVNDSFSSPISRPVFSLNYLHTRVNLVQFLLAVVLRACE